MTDRQTDPWAKVELVHICYGDDAFYYEVDAVDAARAADAAQIAKLVVERDAAYARIVAVYEELVEAQTLREALESLIADAEYAVMNPRIIANARAALRPQEPER